MVNGTALCAFAAALAVLPGIANAGTLPISALNKGTVPLTSFYVWTDNGPDTVTPPAGWVANRIQGTTRGWSLTGGTLAPGATLPATIDAGKNHTAGGSFYGADYKDAKGNLIKITRCPDPLSEIVIGAMGADYNFLGYTIPEGQFGYFFEWWNDPSFTNQTKTATLDVGTNAYNFVVIPNSFSIAQLSQVDGLQVPNSDANLMAVMDPSSATGVPGLATSWSLDPSTGLAMATFLPDSTSGLGGGDVSDIMAFTSPNGPTFTDFPNVSATYVTPFNCPPSSAFVPAPEPGTMALLGLGAALILAGVSRGKNA